MGAKAKNIQGRILGSICLLLLCCCFPLKNLLGQHQAHYGQYMFNGMVLNPAYAGQKGALDLALLTRIQWMGFPGAPRVGTFALHAPSRNLKNNFGVVLVNDRLGPMRRNTLNGAYAYRIPLGKYSLSLGLQGGLRVESLRFEDLGRTDDGDPNLEESVPTVAVPVAGTGLWLSQPNFYLGLSVPELLMARSQQYRTFYQNALSFRHYYATAGFLIKAGRDVRIKPSLLLKYTRAVPLQADFNANVIFKDDLVVGFSYRTNGLLLGLLECYLTDQLRIGFSYEANVAALQAYQSGTLEFSLGYTFSHTVKTPSLRYF